MVEDQEAGAPRPEATPPPPERGQVVNVRGSNWAVTDVIAQGLPNNDCKAEDEDEDEPGLTHVVSLQSLEDDQLGAELSVVWELEAGQTVRPDQGLPEAIGADDFDDPNTLAAFVDAVRWGAVTSADANAYQAPFRSGANVDPYQLEPLRRALRSARTNLLLADDVGLGKTIETGMVVQELLLRHRARSVVIVCPPSLSLKWQDEMQEKFGLRFEIVNSELMARVKRSHGLNANPFRLFPRVIVSMAWLPSLPAQRLLRDVYADVRDARSARRYAFDVLVVDEAHHVAPASPTAPPGFKRYAVDSNRTIATRALAEKCEHRLFLSATPHNGFTESFMALMEMIDDRRFKRGAILDERALKDIAVRRLKADVPEKGFRQRELKTIAFKPDEDEAKHFAELDRILSDSARANRQGRAGGIVAMLLKKRLLSSPWSFAQTLRDYAAAEGGRGTDIDDEDRYYQEVLGSGQSDEEEGEADHPEFTALRRSKRSDPLVAATGKQIEGLIEWSERYKHQPDTRLRALIEFLDATCRPDGTWGNNRVVIFTEYAATLDWIAGILGQRGYRDGTELAVIQGSTPVEDRELIRARFTAPPDQEPVRVLVATDSAGEGIDLQDYCHRLVNFDIPFNPSRLEQRIGRIDRYGQREVPEIYQLTPAPANSAFARSQQFLVNLVKRKIDVVAADLGAVNQVVAGNQVIDMDAEIQQHFAPSGTGRKARLTARDDGTVIINRVLAGGTELNRALTELARTYDQAKAGMHLTPENARRVVDTALDLTGQPPLRPSGLPDLDAAVFEIPSLGPSWQPALRGLETRLKPDVLRPVTFDDTGRGRGDVVHVHLGHAILQRSARVLRSALFSVDSPVHRVTAVVVDGLPQSCVAAVSRLVLVGQGGLRLHEEVFLTGIRLRGQALSEARAEDVLDVALDSRDLALADPEVRASLARLWDAADAPLRTRLATAMANKARARQEKVTDALLKRRDSDIARAREIFEAFRINLIESHALLITQIRSEEEKLFPDDQQRQRRIDLLGMEDRLASLEGEEQLEIAAISARYANIRPHVTAAAVVFALTPQDTAAGRIGA